MDKELLHGTLEIMILKTLQWGAMHGYGIGRWITQLSGEKLHIEEGSLYPALYRLEKKGLIDSEWGLSEKNRRAKYYSLTDDGRLALRKGAAVWTDFSATVARVLSATSQPS